MTEFSVLVLNFPSNSVTFAKH